MTRSYYYDAVSAVRFTGEEEYHTNFVYQPEQVEIKMRDTVAFSPNLFTLRRELEKTDAMGVQGNISYFDGVVSGTVKTVLRNRWRMRLCSSMGKRCCWED